MFSVFNTDFPWSLLIVVFIYVDDTIETLLILYLSAKKLCNKALHSGLWYQIEPQLKI